MQVGINTLQNSYAQPRNIKNKQNKPAFGISATIIQVIPSWSHEGENIVYKNISNAIYPVVEKGLKQAGMPIRGTSMISSKNSLSEFQNSNYPQGQHEGKPATINYLITYDNGDKTNNDFHVKDFRNLQELAQAVTEFMTTGKKIPLISRVKEPEKQGTFLEILQKRNRS